MSMSATWSLGERVCFVCAVSFSVVGTGAHRGRSACITRSTGVSWKNPHVSDSWSVLASSATSLPQRLAVSRLAEVFVWSAVIWHSATPSRHKASSTMSTIRYFVPEDGDSEDQPNVFLAPKPRQQGYPPTLGQVKSAFPLPGAYHFRFKSPLVPGADREKGAMAVWMDCVDDRQAVPSWRGTVVAKVTRLSAEEEDDDDDDDFHRPAAATSAAAPTPAPAPPAAARTQQQPPPPAHHAPAPSIDLFGGPSPSATHSQQHQSAPNSGNLFDHHPAAATSGSGDLLGDMHSHSHQQSTTGAAHNDFLGMTSPPASGGLTPQQQQAMYGNNTGMSRPPPHHSSSFDSFGGTSQGGRSSDGNNAFGGLGTPWKS